MQWEPAPCWTYGFYRTYWNGEGKSGKSTFLTRFPCDAAINGRDGVWKGLENHDENNSNFLGRVKKMHRR